MVSTAFATTQAIVYDFGSLMHYDAYAFTRNGRPTIEPLNSSVSLQSLGQREVLSDGDLHHVSTLYCNGCKKPMFVEYPTKPMLIAACRVWLGKLVFNSVEGML